jgi:predicted nucleic acid-binding protein
VTFILDTNAVSALMKGEPRVTRGRLLLEREEGHWKRFKARAWVDWWEWAPIARRCHREAIARLRASTYGRIGSRRTR